MANLKSCSKCSSEKDESLFPIYNGKRWYWCIACQRAAAKSYRANFPDRVRAAGVSYRERNKDKIRERNRLYRARNSDKLREKCRKRRLAQLAKNPNWDRDRQRKRVWGITPQKYDDMLYAQSGVCGICRKPSPIPGRNLSIDHDHATGAIRGLLCMKCNYAIGLLDDNIECLGRAIEYLKKYSVIGA